MQYTIKLANGTELTGLTKNGDNFISTEEITSATFADGCSRVEINDEVHENMELVQIVQYPNRPGEWWFVLRDIPEIELKLKVLESLVNGASDNLHGEKMKAIINSIATPEKPSDMPNRPGYKWELKYTWGDSSYVWEEVEDPNAEGTEDKPIAWYSGMTVYANYWYINDGVEKVCVKAGNPTDFVDEAEEYFVAM